MHRYKGHMPNKYMHYNKYLALLQLHEAVLNKEIIQLTISTADVSSSEEQCAILSTLPPRSSLKLQYIFNTGWLKLKVKSVTGEQNKANCTMKGVNLWYQLN